MDEILIEEKKFVSSKRAAKMTGYAKDYIGQLCREGRVQARLIGRSWYVLEAAIQDHRFGTPEEPEKIMEVSQEPIRKPITSTWESPRYEATSDELLPAINRLKDAESPVDTDTASQRIQDSWKAWFDRFDHAEGADVSVGDVIKVPEEQPEVIESEEIKETPYEEIAETSVNVPVRISRSLYRPPPEDFLPRNVVIPSPREQIMHKKGDRRGVLSAIRIVGIVIAVLAVSIAVIGSGYFDAYILSNNPARIIAGVGLYSK